MKLNRLLEGLSPQEIFIADNPTITDIVYDSRKVTEGSLFVAVEGFAVDGNTFVSKAVSQGAVAIVSQKEPLCDGVAWIQVADVRSFMALLAFRFWNVDFNALFTVAVTGTNGKTTIVTLFNELNRLLYGEKFAWQIGTTGHWLGEKFVDTNRTTPEAIDLLKMMGESIDPPKSLAMEASSHALVLERVKGFLFDVAIFTNLTQDHLDFHSDMEEYYEAKKRLFTMHLKENGYAVVNIDDSYGKRLASELSGNVITYGREKSADFSITQAHCSWDGISFRATFGGKKLLFKSALVGHFNIANMAAVAAGALAYGIDKEIIDTMFQKVKPVAGRMDKVFIDAPFSVVVDYAHTPDALKNVLFTARKLTKGRVISVFGAGGDRDRTKRAPMAEVVALSSDYAFVTSDNPRTEAPLQILSDLEDGIPSDFPFETIADRREAIKQALLFAKEGDSILIAGKGHETYQEINGVKHHFDDREEVALLWNQIGAECGA